MVPYVVNIRLKDDHVCTGSIISSKFVLTAAVCVEDSPDYVYKVQSGSAIENIGGSFHTVERVIRHTDFKRIAPPENDIALLEVNPPFEFDETRDKIPLSDEENPSGVLATTAGWGMSLEQTGSSPKLQVAKVPIISKEECQNILRKRNKIKDSEICAGYVGKGFEIGVSGSPLVANGAQVGILSWGRLRGMNPDVYTLVSKYKSWIRNYVPDI